MSSSGSSNVPTAKLQDPSADASKQEQVEKPKVAKDPTVLEEDDEFEDFPVDDWPMEEAEVPGGDGEANAHLWEESWDDDDDTSEPFSKQLKEELDKVRASEK